MAVDVISQIYNVAAMFASSTPATGVQTLTQIPRVQNVGVQFNVPRQDVQIIGQMDRIDNIIASAPEVTCNIDYIALDGKAEDVLGFSTKNLNTTFISGFLDKTTDEKNYYLLLAREGYDAIGSTDSTNNNVVALGNGYVTNYSLNMSVGDVPRSSVSISAHNFATYNGTSGKANPAISPETDALIGANPFTLPTAVAYTGTAIPSSLRSAELFLSLPSDASVGDYMSGAGKIHVNSVGISLPINRTPITELGHFYPIAKKYTPPTPITVSIDGLAGDVSEDSIAALRCNDGTYNFRVNMCKPNCGGMTGTPSMIWDVKGVKLDSRDFSIGVGGGAATVRLTFSTQASAIGTNTSRGIFMSGAW